MESQEGHSSLALCHRTQHPAAWESAREATPRQMFLETMTEEEHDHDVVVSLPTYLAIYLSSPPSGRPALLVRSLSAWIALYKYLRPRLAGVALLTRDPRHMDASYAQLHARSMVS